MAALVFAIIVILAAHFLRVLRWQQLIMTYERPDTGRLMKALSLGYFINFFIPFKLGELVRALYAGTKMKNGRGFALATVIVERCLDVISVGVIFIIIRAAGLITGYEAGYYIILAGGLAVAITLVYITRDIWKKYVFRLASLFNVRVEEKLLRFFWALIWGFKDIVNKLPKLKLIAYTVVMWALYLISYGLFAVFLTGSGMSSDFTDVFYSLFAQGSLFASGFAVSTQTLMYALFLLLPVVIMFAAAGPLSGRFSNKAYGDTETLNLLPHINPDERRTFLELYFSGENKSYIGNYLKINRNILVLRDYSAGSDATTILCTDGERSFYRKYAFTDAGIKLNEQIKWLEANQGKLPLTQIINKDFNDDACYYDMPYVSDAVTMFEFIHSAPKERAWEILEGVLESLKKGLYDGDSKVMGVGVAGSDETGGGDADLHNMNIGKNTDENAIASYIDGKIIKNIDIIRNSKELKDILKYDSLIINGKEYSNLSAYMDMFRPENLSEVFKDDVISEIHGDLTIENIICSSDGFYLIDPNTGNILNSQFIDYAKLLQSLHGKYEFLQSVKSVTVNENNIEFTFLKSEAYDYLYGKYSTYLKEHFSDGEIKSIYYHEIVNFLRLMPYKLRKGNGLLFYCGLIMILNDIRNLFE